MVFFKIKVNACILIQPINIYRFLGESFKGVLYFTYTVKENWKEGYNSNNMLKFSLPAPR